MRPQLLTRTSPTPKGGDLARPRPDQAAPWSREDRVTPALRSREPQERSPDGSALLAAAGPAPADRGERQQLWAQTQAECRRLRQAMLEAHTWIIDLTAGIFVARGTSMRMRRRSMKPSIGIVRGR